MKQCTAPALQLAERDEATVGGGRADREAAVMEQLDRMRTEDPDGYREMMELLAALVVRAQGRSAPPGK